MPDVVAGSHLKRQPPHPKVRREVEMKKFKYVGSKHSSEAMSPCLKNQVESQEAVLCLPHGSVCACRHTQAQSLKKQIQVSK